MRETVSSWKKRDSRIVYRGDETSRLDNLTDVVFGIAITLLIFSSAAPTSVADIIAFTKTLPAFLISIALFFLLLILKKFSISWTSIVGGMVYALYGPSMCFWSRNYNKLQNQFDI
ncbi:MAG: small neutral amino acid transporter SnatA (MarC family) [Arcticibacterium sp.]|jgi:small neutral amino acid transporter SnatA (MarC family)